MYLQRKEERCMEVNKIYYISEIVPIRPCEYCLPNFKFFYRVLKTPDRPSDPWNWVAGYFCCHSLGDLLPYFTVEVGFQLGNSV